eukprot:2467270-Rhodomonas_salina.3
MEMGARKDRVPTLIFVSNTSFASSEMRRPTSATWSRKFERDSEMIESRRLNTEMAHSAMNIPNKNNTIKPNVTHSCVIIRCLRKN